MRFLLIPSLVFILFSCGEAPVEEKDGSNVNQIMTINKDEKLTTEEKTNLDRVCNSIINKEYFFKRTIVVTGRILRFSVRKKACTGPMGSATTFSSQVEESSSGLRLKSAGSLGLSELLTTNSFQLKNFCLQSTSNADIQRAEIYGKNATRLEIQQGGQGNCGKDKRDVCLFFASGIKTDTENEYRVKDVQRYRIRVDSNSESDGVALNQSLESSQFCSGPKQFSVIEQSSLDF